MVRTYELSNNIIDSLYDELIFSFEWSNRWADDGYLELNIRDTSRFATVLEMLRMLFNIRISCCTYEDEKGFSRISYAKIVNHIFIERGQINSKELRDSLWELVHLEDKDITNG